MELRAKEPSEIARRVLLTPFDLAGVRLKPGMFECQFEQMRSYFLGLSNDSILKGFRERAGLSAPGSPLGGWYSADMPLPLMFPARPTTLCSTFGQWLGVFARIYRATGDGEARSKAEALLTEWAKTIGPDGYFFYGSTPAIRHYDFDKTLGGLIDLYQYAGIEAAIRHATTITDWAMRHLERRRIPATPDCQSGGGWVGGSDADAEWYTLSENLYRLYLVTGRDDHRAFAELWHYDRYWRKLAARDPAAMTGLHAYSHVNTLSSAAMAYAVSGRVEFLQTLKGAYEVLCRSQLFATGGYGPGERLAADKEGLIDSLVTQRDTFETGCGTWAAFKFVRHLQSFTARASYGDWVERLLYNGVGAALPPADGGRTFYYADYRISGGQKTYYLDRRFPAGPIPDHTPFPCCSGTYPLAVTEYHNLLYYRDAHSLYVNLYVPSEVRFLVDGEPVTADLCTSYPVDGVSTLRFASSGAFRLALKFRVPEWVSTPVDVRINGNSVNVASIPGSWGLIERTWRDGDTVLIDIPLGPRLEPLDGGSAGPSALLWGPVVLAAKEDGPIEARELPERLRRLHDDALDFELAGPHGRKTFKPFYAFHEGERYYLYHRVE